MKKSVLRIFLFAFLLSTLCFAANAAEMSTQSSAVVLENKIVFHVEFSEALDNEFISIGLYDTDGRMVDYFMVPALYGKTSTDIVTDDAETAEYAKIFVMADKSGLIPLSDAEAVTVDRTGGEGTVYPPNTYTLEYQAVATPHYSFAGEEPTAYMGYEAVLFEYAGDDDKIGNAPVFFYAPFDELGIKGSADNYIMSHFKLVITLDDDYEVAQIHSAEPLMVKKTVTEMELGRVTTNNKDSYFDSDYTEKRLNGSVIFDGGTAYFYNAPSDYVSSKYLPDMTEEEKYNLRNRNNLQFITESVYEDVDDGNYVFEVMPVNFIGYEDEYHVTDAATLASILQSVYTDGLYEAAFYDVNGDGVYDYINYKPYSVYFADTDEDYTFYDDGFAYNDNTRVYTEGARLEGKKFTDGDYILGYFNPQANYIKVADVIEPVEATVKRIKKYNGLITLTNDEEICVTDGWKKVLNYAVDLSKYEYAPDEVEWAYFDELLGAEILTEASANYYYYDGSLLYREAIDHSMKFECEKLIVVTEDEDGNYLRTVFDPTIGEKIYYVHVWVDGETKYVPINDDEMYPEFGEYYLNKMARYSVDENGFYTIELLGYAEDEYEDYIGIPWLEELDDVNNLENEENTNIRAYAEIDKGYLVKRVGARYHLRDGVTDGDALLDFDLILNDNTVILIKNTYLDGDDEVIIDWVELEASDIKDTIANQLKNIQIVVTNNVDSKTSEYLAGMFAEVKGSKLELPDENPVIPLENTKRIVKMMDVEMNEDGKYYAVYDLFNPYTGALVENVAGTNLSTSDSYTSKFTYGDIVELSSDMEVMDYEEDERVGNIIEGGNTNENVYLVTDYIASENCLEIVNIPANIKEGDDLDAAIEASDMYSVDVANAKVTIIGHQSAAFGTDMVRWGSIKVADIAKLDGSDKSYLALNSNYFKDDNSAAKTVYAKYVKAYIDVEWNEDRALDEDDYNGKANFIVVIANTGENLGLCYIR